MKGGRFSFGFFGRLVGNDIIYAELLMIDRILADLSEAAADKAALEATLAKLRTTDTVIDNIEPTQGVPQ